LGHLAVSLVSLSHPVEETDRLAIWQATVHLAVDAVLNTLDLLTTAKALPA